MRTFLLETQIFTEKTGIFWLYDEISGIWRQIGGIGLVSKEAQFYCRFRKKNRIKK